MNDKHGEEHSCCHGGQAKREPEPAPPVQEEQSAAKMLPDLKARELLELPAPLVPELSV